MLFDFETLSPNDTYKLLASTVLPRPIAWVVTQDDAGGINAAPYSFFNAVSGDPPVLAIGVGARAEGGIKDSGRNIAATGEFVVNLVTSDLMDAMNVTAIDFPHGTNELAEAGLTAAPSTHVRPPRIAESPVAYECRHLQTIELGPDRWLVLGRVVALHLADDAVQDAARCYVDASKLDLVGRMAGGGGYVRTTDRFELPRLSARRWAARGTHTS